MSGNTFSYNTNAEYIEAVKALFESLGIELTDKECVLPLTELLKLKSVKSYDYRRKIRKHIGQSPLSLPGGNVILYCKTPNNSIAILVQNRNDFTEGKYSFCGGAQEIYEYNNMLAMESTLLTVYREVWEETDISINHIKLVPYFNYSSYIEYQNGDQVLAPSNFYIAELPYLELFAMSKAESDEEWSHMTHSLINTSTINQEFIDGFAPNHRPALIRFLNEFVWKKNITLD